MRIPMLLAALLVFAQPVLADDCIRYGMDEGIETTARMQRTRTPHCRCMMDKVRRSSLLSNEQKANLIEDYTEDPYQILGVDERAVERGEVVLTEKQQAPIAEMQGNVIACPPLTR